MLLTFYTDILTLSRSLLFLYQLICLRFVAYVSPHLLFCIYWLVSNGTKKHNSDTKHITRKIKPIVLIICLHENFKLEYLRIKFYCFFIAFWPPVPKVTYSLVYNTSDTSNTNGTWVQHEWDRSNASITQTTQVRHEWKLLILITTRAKTFLHTHIFTIWQVKDYKGGTISI